MHRAWSTYLVPGDLINTRPIVRDPSDHESADEQAHYYITGDHERSGYQRRRASSIISTGSNANSTRHMLDHHQGSSRGLDPPNAPFAQRAAAASTTSLRTDSPLLGKDSPLSLSVNYLPSKFAPPSSVRKRKGGKGMYDQVIPKRGGGREAFKSRESRMPGPGDMDYDGVTGTLWGSGKNKTTRNRWNVFKWVLFASNTVFTIYSVVGLIFCLLTWFNVWYHADVLRVANRPELIVSTIAASLGLLTAMIGWAGILLNNRAFLAIYSLLLWFCFALLVAPGYITYRNREFDLEGKLNAQWSRALGTDGRLRVQNQLECCGYFSPYVEATVSQTCYSRSVLPGCKAHYLQFQGLVLKRWYTVSFSLVPLQLAIMLAGLLCSNHVTYRFGKGMMPKAYRLSMTSMAVIMDNYANQLAEQYGTDIATDALNRSKLNLPLESDTKAQNMAYYDRSVSSGHTHNKYDSLHSRAPEGAL